MALDDAKIGAPRNAGLCADCQHARLMKSDRGAVFLLCQLSFEDSSFRKYPRLPVLGCSGYTKVELKA